MRALRYRNFWGESRKVILIWSLFTKGPSGLCFAIKVHPRARKNAITGELGVALKASLTATPIDGRANGACIDSSLTF